MYINGFKKEDLCFDPEYAQEILDEASNNEYANLKEDIDTLINMSVKVFGSALTDRELFDAIFKLYDVQEWDIDFALLIKSNQWLDLYDIINDFLKEENMPKFDIAIMNPPYDRNLHLKILEKVIPIADKVVNISPVRWLQDPLAKYKKNSDYKKFEESISKKIESLDVIDSNDAQNIFKSAVFCIDLGIYTIGNCGYNYTCNNSIIDKVCNYVAKHGGLPIEKYVNRTHNNYMLIASIVGGNGSSQNCFVSKPTLNYNERIYGKFFVNDMSELRHENLHECKKKYGGYWGKCDNWNVCSFATVDELVNFYNSTHTKFFRYVYWTSTVDVHVHPEFLPYMQDYTQPWTDKRFCEYFNITGYIDDDHAEPGSEWETILNTMKEYK